MNARSLVRIAHRGGGHLARENSIEGIERSIALGMEMVEVDVRRTADDALVLSHDPVLHGTPLPVAAQSLAELRAGSPHEVHTLHEALDAVRGRVRINLDIKDEAAAPGVLRAIGDAGMRDQCIVSCLDGACLAGIREAEPSLEVFYSYPPDYGGASSRPWLTPVVNAAVAYMRATMPRRLRTMLRPMPGASATIYYRLVTPRLVMMAHALGVSLYTWTVDDAAEMRRLAGMGIDGITSNRPDLLAELSVRPLVTA